MDSDFGRARLKNGVFMSERYDLVDLPPKQNQASVNTVYLT